MFENSTIQNEIRAITQQGPKEVHYNYAAFVQLPDGRLIQSLKLLELDIDREYVENFSDAINVRLLFGANTFVSKIYPFKENLKIIVKREVIGEVEEKVDRDKNLDIQTFRAVLIDHRDYSKEDMSPLLNDEVLGDISDVIGVSFQLLDECLEWLRSVTVGGIFRAASSGDVLKSILTLEAKEMPLEQDSKITAIDFVEPDNQERRQQTIVPHGTSLIRLPSYLQESCGGIYNAGIGFYLQQSVWYVWPLFNTKRFDDSPIGLTVINVPENRMPGLERTYRVTRNQVVILSTGKTVSKDDSTNRQLDGGNGVRFRSSNTVLEGFGETKGNRTTLSRSRNNTEVLVRESKSGLNRAPVSKNKITDNLFKELSILSRSQGQFIQVSWENSNNSLITPGMPVRYIYAVGEETRMLHGCVVHAQHFIHLRGEGIMAKRYGCNSALTLFLDMDDYDEFQ